VRPGVRVGLNTRVDWDTVHIEGPVCIGSGTVIEPGAVLRGPVWIGTGCRIEAGATVERSVLFDHAQVAANATASDMLVSGSFCVGRDGQADTTARRWWGDARSRKVHHAAVRMAA